MALDIGMATQNPAHATLKDRKGLMRHAGTSYGLPSPARVRIDGITDVVSALGQEQTSDWPEFGL